MNKRLNIVLPRDVARKIVRIKQVTRKGLSHLLAERAAMNTPATAVTYVAKGEGKFNRKLTGVAVGKDTLATVEQVAALDGRRPTEVALAMIVEAASWYTEEELQDVTQAQTTTSISVHDSFMERLANISEKTGAGVGLILRLAIRNHERGDLSVMFPHPDAGTARGSKTAIKVRISKEQHPYIHKLAQDKGLSLNKTCVALLEAHIVKEEPHEW